MSRAEVVVAGFLVSFVGGKLKRTIVAGARRVLVSKAVQASLRKVNFGSRSRGAQWLHSPAAQRNRSRSRSQPLARPRTPGRCCKLPSRGLRYMPVFAVVLPLGLIIRTRQRLLLCLLFAAIILLSAVSYGGGASGGSSTPPPPPPTQYSVDVLGNCNGTRQTLDTISVTNLRCIELPLGDHAECTPPGLNSPLSIVNVPMIVNLLVCEHMAAIWPFPIFVRGPFVQGFQDWIQRRLTVC